MWATNLAGARDEAIATTSNEVYERYMRYLTGCADFFRRGISELGQFTLTKG
jgi:cyclopropane-fatty-acyl-phospholipid synthase